MLVDEGDVSTFKAFSSHRGTREGTTIVTLVRTVLVASEP